MGGYNYTAGMSNRAVGAYEQGRKPLSQFTLKDLRDAGWKGTLKLAKFLAKDGFWESDEWHHTGGTWYNQTDFYNPETLVEQWHDLEDSKRTAFEVACKNEGKPQASDTMTDFEKHMARLAEWEAKPKKVKGSYPEYSGSGRRRRLIGHIAFTGEMIGDWIYLDDGGKKKASGNHIKWEFV